MKVRASIKYALAAFVVFAVAAPMAAFADDDDDRKTSYRERHLRVLYAVDDGGKLLRFRASSPGSVSGEGITGLPAGVKLSGIDFRPATGDLYAVGSDRVVYRVNTNTAIAVAEGPTFDTNPPTALTGTSVGFDFNPTVDKIRLTSNADENLRLNPDEGNVLAVDTKLTPASVTVVGSAYTNSSFVAFPGRPAATTLYDVDIASSPDTLWTQSPANAGTLINPKTLGFDLGSSLGFDIVAADNVGYVAGTPQGGGGARLYRVDVTTGETRDLGRISGGAVTVVGLAAWQD